MDPLSIGKTALYLEMNLGWRETSDPLSMLQSVEPDLFKLIQIIETVEHTMFDKSDFDLSIWVDHPHAKILLLYQFGFLSIRHTVPSVGPLEKTRPSLNELLAAPSRNNKYYLAFGNDTGKRYFEKLLSRRIFEESSQGSFAKLLDAWEYDYIYNALYFPIRNQGEKPTNKQRIEMITTHEHHIENTLWSSFTTGLTGEGNKYVITPQPKTGFGKADMLVKNVEDLYGWIFELKRDYCIGLAFIQLFFNDRSSGLGNEYKRRDMVAMDFPIFCKEIYNSWIATRRPIGGSEFSEFYTPEGMSTELAKEAIIFMKLVIACNGNRTELGKIVCPFCTKKHVRDNKLEGRR